MSGIDSLIPSPDTLTCQSPRILHIELNSGATDIARLESILSQTTGVELVHFHHDTESKVPDDLPAVLSAACSSGRVVELSIHSAAFPLSQIDELLSSGVDCLRVVIPDTAGVLSGLRLCLSTLRRTQRELGTDKPRCEFVFEIASRAGLSQVAELARDLEVERVVVHPKAVPVEASLREALPGLLRTIRSEYPGVSIDASTCEEDPLAPLSAHPRFTSRSISGRERVYSCLENPWDSTRVLPNGDVVTCALRKHLVVGNLEREPLEQIWKNEASQEFRKKFQLGNDAVCRQCPRKLAYMPSAVRTSLRPEEGNTIEFVSGWHWGEGQIIWSKPRSRCLLAASSEGAFPHSREKSVELEGMLPPGSGTIPNEIRVSHKGQTLASSRNASGEIRAFRLVFSFPGSFDCAQFEFSVSQPFFPKDTGSPDRRELGFALISLRSVIPPDRRLPRWRCLPLYLALELGRRAASFLQRFDRRPIERRPWTPGISVIIPECGTPELLRRALSSAVASAACLDEETELIVVVNGVPFDLYARHRREFPMVRWLHSDRILGYSGAISKGVRRARFDWVYLLNSDMTLDSGALREVARWRSPHVFAISSQVFFADPVRRREETGWTNFTIRSDGEMELFDAVPEDNSTVRGHLYAGGGNSLFRRDVLLRVLRPSHFYNPAYWEDVEWGVRAWRSGYEVLFCPASHVVHVHRATVSRLFSQRELDRIWKRNQFLFSIRNNFCDHTDPAKTRAAIRNLRSAFDLVTQRDLTALPQALSVFRSLLSNARAATRDVDLSRVCGKYYLRPAYHAGTRATALFVSPFVVYPAAHGGARRIANLIEQLSQTFDIVLLTDEELSYCVEDTACARGPISIHLTGGRPDTANLPGDRISRIRAHSHAVLRAEMHRLARVYNVAFVQLEYMELAELAAPQRAHGPRYILDLHDVLLSEGRQTSEDIYERSLMARYDAVLACSREDADLVRHKRVAVVPNGFTPRPHAYRPSRGSRMLLFMGPFRYAPNLAGVRCFLEHVYPELLREVSGLELTILGGTGSRAIAQRYPCFDQPGIKLVDRPADAESWLQLCALTINPLVEVRGSALKVIESIGFGRVCVSTHSGARGFAEVKANSLITVPRVQDFHEPLCRLLLDENLRLSLERPEDDVLSELSWESIGRRQRLLYQEWL